jgi:HAD superfamily, subfamily IIIB (Acid phosphatase)
VTVMIGTTVRHRVRHQGRLRAGVSAAVCSMAIAAGVLLTGAGPASAQVHARAAASAPTNGEKIPNITLVEDQIEAYYGNVDVHVKASNPIFRFTGDTEHLPSPKSNYAKQMHGIEAGAMTYLRAQSSHPTAKPAVVFDIDDTLLNTYNYGVALQFGFTSASNGVFVDNEAFPAVFGMPALVNWAGSHGYTVFFITGRPDTQRRPTAGNLSKVGIKVPDGTDRLFLKSATPPSYLSCGTSCSTIQYKSGTRRHIESMGYHIVASFGDQFSDLKGGFAQRTFKLPNPMYFLP